MANCMECGEKLIMARFRCVAQEQRGTPCRNRLGKIQYYHSVEIHASGWPCKGNARA